MLADPIVYPIFWGSAYATRNASGAVTRQHPCVASMGDFLNGLRVSWLGGLHQYGVLSLGYVDGEPDTLAPGTDPTGVTQSQAEQELVRFITWSGAGVPQPEETQHCFVLLLPPGASLSDAPGACGYHGSTYYAKATGDHNLFYAVIATPALSPSESGDAFINSISYCISHELAEMFTNPDGRGWFADASPAQRRDQVCEIGDICELAGLVQTAGKWTVEKYWSQTGQTCFDPASGVPAPIPPPAPPPPGPPPHVNCQVLAERLGQLEAAIAQISRDPASPSQQAQLQQLERELFAAQTAYQRECIGRHRPEE
ncbi:MAG: hypothetical protein JO023_17350 [Chloroflexi bacterium]|nr:hypothetical protein [Chloroflexota bacterium]